MLIILQCMGGRVVFFLHCTAVAFLISLVLSKTLSIDVGDVVCSWLLHIRAVEWRFISFSRGKRGCDGLVFGLRHVLPLAALITSLGWLKG